MEDLIDAYPLAWPPGVQRTGQYNRKRADFGRQVQKYRQERGQDGLVRSVPSWKSREALTIAQALERLQHELEGFGHRTPLNRVVVSSNLRVRRTDGLPLSGQREPQDPGVAVYFELDKERRCIPSDKWDRVADNIAGIAAAIGALRGLERWVNDANVRAAFRGFLALPDPNRVDWRAAFGFKKDQPVTVVEVNARYRELAKEHHHDVLQDGGKAMSLLNRARMQAHADLGG